MYRAVSTKAYDVKGTYPFLCSAFPAFNSYKLVSTFQLEIIFRYVIFDMLKCEGIAEVESRWQSRYFMTVRFKRTFVGQQRSSFFRRCVYPSVVEKFSKYFAKICARVHVYMSFISVVQKEREYGYERKKERPTYGGWRWGWERGREKKRKMGERGRGIVQKGKSSYSHLESHTPYSIQIPTSVDSAFSFLSRLQTASVHVRAHLGGDLVY